MITTGQRLGSYEILALIGVGGMGEVYKARDTRLDRLVAIKVLAAALGDRGFKQRFEREARTISSLNHPHICTLHDIGHDNGIDFLVMELLEGETAAQRLDRGPLPLPHVLRYAIEIVEALDRAHRQGITHRDLKPANIMLTKSGAKLLDFGLAKPQSSPVQMSTGATASPSLLTASGTILGTLQYMAPEQLEGKPADHRSDIFAFGAIVYEMVTGRKAFQGESQASLIGAILKDEPPAILTLQPLSSPELDRLIATCLAKDPDERWQSAGDIGRQLKVMQAGASTPGAMSSPSSRTTNSRWFGGLSVPAALAAFLAGAVLASAAVWSLTRPVPREPPRVSRLVIDTPPNARLANLGGYDVVISPDGERVAYYVASVRNDSAVLYVRELDDVEARLLPGSEIEALGSQTNLNPFFSPDGASIGFRAPGRGLMRVGLPGGPALKISDDDTAFLGAAWAADDTVIFGLPAGLFRVSANGGGTPVRLTAPGGGDFYTAPSLLHGRNAVLFGIVQDGVSNVAVLDLDTSEERILVRGADNPVYLRSGHLVFARDTTLMAAPFDAERLVLAGEPVAVQPGVRRPNATSATDFAVAADGTLVYVPSGGGTNQFSLVWVDRGGRVLARAVEDPLDHARDPRLSPDARRLAVTVGDTADFTSSSLWIHDLDGGPPIPLTEGFGGVWSPDGATIAFSVARIGRSEIATLPSDGSIRIGRALYDDALAVPGSFSAGGELFMHVFANRGDIVAIRLDGDNEIRAVLATQDADTQPAVSPDGRWLAYTSDRTGQTEVWAKRLPDGAPVRISRTGGVEPVWARDGSEIFYRRADAMFAVAVESNGAEVGFGEAVELFAAPFFASVASDMRSYDVAPDGRFLMIQRSENATPSGSIVVVQNWMEELKRRVPVP